MSNLIRLPTNGSGTSVALDTGYQRRRFVRRLALAFVGGIAAVALLLLLSLRIAHAQPGSGSGSGAAPVPDPTADAGGFVDKLSELWRSGAIMPFVIVALFGIALALRKLVPWFSTGKRAVYTAGAMLFLTALVEAAASGTTPNLGMVVAALGSAIALVLKPQTSAPPA